MKKRNVLLRSKNKQQIIICIDSLGKILTNVILFQHIRVTNKTYAFFIVFLYYFCFSLDLTLSLISPCVMDFDASP
jgi:hypothetical protein